MKVIVTCGPAFAPVDEVRRLTNFSTGELGLMLSAELMHAGHEVVCMKGEGAVSHTDAGGAQVVPFTTNASLLELLHEFVPQNIGAIFHAAALCDYEVKAVQGSDGAALAARKIPTLSGDIILTLRPAAKLLPELRGLFPGAKIVGWKYELNGNRADAEAKARTQIAGNDTDACVVNGAAWGPGFGFIEPEREDVQLADKRALCAFLAQWLDAGK